MVCDPFHDTPISVVGAPDNVSGRSLVYDVRRQLIIKKPDAIAGNWDAHVAFIPALIDWSLSAADGGTAGYNFQALVYNNTGQVNAPTATSVLLPLNENNYSTVAGTKTNFPDGGPFFVSTVATDTPTYSPYNDGLQVGYIKAVDVTNGLPFGTGNKVRLVGAAFEVHNTTADLYKQGSVTCYRTASETQETQLTSIYSELATPSSVQGAAHQFSPFTLLQGPPSSVSQAKQLDGITWEAREGALVPCHIDFSQNKPCVPDARQLILTSQDQGSPLLPTNMVCGFIQGGSMAKYDQRNACGSSLAVVPGSQSGAYFVGLSPETSLTMSVRCFFEVFPSPNSELYSLTRPSPRYDPLVETVLDKVWSELQPGYPVSFNAKGDFFKNIVSSLKSSYKVMTPMMIAGLTSSADPRLMAAGAALSTIDAAGNAVAKSLKRVKQENKNAKQAQQQKKGNKK